MASSGPAEWRTDSEYVWRRIRRSIVSGGAVVGYSDGSVMGWLPKEQSDYISEGSGRAAALWHVAYDTGTLAGDEEDLEESELMESLVPVEGVPGDLDCGKPRHGPAAIVTSTTKTVSFDNSAPFSPSSWRRRRSQGSVGEEPNAHNDVDEEQEEEEEEDNDAEDGDDVEDDEEMDGDDDDHDEDDDEDKDKDENGNEGLSEYERLRRQRMAANQAFLAELGFNENEATLKKAKAEGAARRIKRVVEDLLPSRRSGRNEGKQTKSYNVNLVYKKMTREQRQQELREAREQRQQRKLMLQMEKQALEQEKKDAREKRKQDKLMVMDQKRAHKRNREMERLALHKMKELQGLMMRAARTATSIEKQVTKQKQRRSRYGASSGQAQMTALLQDLVAEKPAWLHNLGPVDEATGELVEKADGPWLLAESHKDTVMPFRGGCPFSSVANDLLEDDEYGDMSNLDVAKARLEDLRSALDIRSARRVTAEKRYQDLVARRSIVSGVAATQGPTGSQQHQSRQELSLEKTTSTPPAPSSSSATQLQTERADEAMEADQDASHFSETLRERKEVTGGKLCMPINGYKTVDCERDEANALPAIGSSTNSSTTNSVESIYSKVAPLKTAASFLSSTTSTYSLPLTSVPGAPIKQQTQESTSRAVTAATTVAALEKQESLGASGATAMDLDESSTSVARGRSTTSVAGTDGATITAPLLSTSVGIDWSSEDGSMATTATTPQHQGSVSSLDLTDVPMNLLPQESRRENSTSRYRGVTLIRSLKENGEDRWKAQITSNGVKFHLGSFATELEAGVHFARAYHKLFVMVPSSMTDAVKQSNIDQNKESSSVLKPHPENASAAASQGPGSQPPERLDDDRGGGGGGTSSSGGDGGDKTGSGDEPCGNAHETKKPLSHRNQPLEKQEMEHEGEKQQMNRDAQSAESLGSQDKRPQHGDTAAISGVTSMVGMAKENESSHMGTASLVGFEDPDQIDSSSISDSMGLAILAPGPFFCSCGGGGDGTTDGGTYVPQVGDQVVYFQQAQEEINRQSKMATPLRKDGDASSAATKPLSLSFAEKKLMQPSWFGIAGSPHAVDCTVVAVHYRFSKDHRQRLYDCMDFVLSRIEDDSGDAFEWFAQPVDPVADGAPEYAKIITHPMDFGTIRERLDHGLAHYESFDAFLKDVRLVLKNAYTFNDDEESEVFQAAKVLEAVLDKALRDLNLVAEAGMISSLVPRVVMQLRLLPNYMIAAAREFEHAGAMVRDGKDAVVIDDGDPQEYRTPVSSEVAHGDQVADLPIVPWVRFGESEAEVAQGGGFVVDGFNCAYHPALPSPIIPLHVVLGACRERWAVGDTVVWSPDGSLSPGHALLEVGTIVSLESRSDGSLFNRDEVRHHGSSADSMSCDDVTSSTKYWAHLPAWRCLHVKSGLQLHKLQVWEVRRPISPEEVVLIEQVKGSMAPQEQELVLRARELRRTTRLCTDESDALKVNGAKVVQHIDEEGNVITVYASQKQAAHDLDEDPAQISMVVRGALPVTRKGNRFSKPSEDEHTDRMGSGDGCESSNSGGGGSSSSSSSSKADQVVTGRGTLEENGTLQPLPLCEEEVRHLDYTGSLIGVFRNERDAAEHLHEDVVEVHLVLTGAWDKTRRGNRFVWTFEAVESSGISNDSTAAVNPSSRVGTIEGYDMDVEDASAVQGAGGGAKAAASMTVGGEAEPTSVGSEPPPSLLHKQLPIEEAQLQNGRGCCWVARLPPIPLNRYQSTVLYGTWPRLDQDEARKMSLALDAVMTTGAAEPFLDKPEAYAPQPKADAAPLPTVRRPQSTQRPSKDALSLKKRKRASNYMKLRWCRERMHVTHFVYGKGLITKVSRGEPFVLCKFLEREDEKSVRVTTIKADPDFPDEFRVHELLLDAVSRGDEQAEAAAEKEADALGLGPGIGPPLNMDSQPQSNVSGDNISSSSNDNSDGKGDHSAKPSDGEVSQASGESKGDRLKDSVGSPSAASAVPSSDESGRAGSETEVPSTTNRAESSEALDQCRGDLVPGAWIPGGAGGGGRRVTADGRDPLEGNCGGYASGAKGGTGKNVGGQVDPKPPPEPSPAERGLKYSSVVPAPVYLELVQARLKSGYYRQYEAVVADVRRIYFNCAQFHASNSSIVRQAKMLVRLVCTMLGGARMLDANGRNFPNNKPLISHSSALPVSSALAFSASPAAAAAAAAAAGTSGTTMNSAKPLQNRSTAASSENPVTNLSHMKANPTVPINRPWQNCLLKLHTVDAELNGKEVTDLVRAAFVAARQQTSIANTARPSTYQKLNDGLPSSFQAKGASTEVIATVLPKRDGLNDMKVDDTSHADDNSVPTESITPNISSTAPAMTMEKSSVPAKCLSSSMEMVVGEKLDATSNAISTASTTTTDAAAPTLLSRKSKKVAGWLHSNTVAIAELCLAYAVANKVSVARTRWYALQCLDVHGGWELVDDDVAGGNANLDGHGIGDGTSAAAALSISALQFDASLRKQYSHRSKFTKGNKGFFAGSMLSDHSNPSGVKRQKIAKPLVATRLSAKIFSSSSGSAEAAAFVSRKVTLKLRNEVI